jgi:hypothetical protein
MHSAPRLRLTCGSDAIWRGVHFTLAAAAASVAVHWMMSRSGLRAELALATALVAAGVAGWLGLCRVPATATSKLEWDGRGWALDDRPGTVLIALDFDAWMLLRFEDQADRRVHWLPLRPRAVGVPAHLCRAALHAHAGAPPSAAPADPGQAARG